MKQNVKNTLVATKIPIWQITKDGFEPACITWKNAANKRFATYDSGTAQDDTDDLVLDKETGLVWERFPNDTERTYAMTSIHAIQKILGNRLGWRVPTVEELASLLDPSTPDALPAGHPFINLQTGLNEFYWTSSTYVGDTAYAWSVSLDLAYPSPTLKSASQFVWCVRGGYGHDAY